MKKKIKSKIIVDVTTSNKCGFAIPINERVTLYSLNKKKEALDYEWEIEGMDALKKALPNRRIEKVREISYFDLKGNQLK